MRLEQQQNVLLILAELQGITFLVFRKLLRTAGNRRSSLPDRLWYPDNFNHSHQITQSEKMLIIASRRNGTFSSKFSVDWYWRASSLELTVVKLLCSVVIQNVFYLACTSTGSLSDQFYQVSIANRLWPVTNSVHWIANVVHVCKFSSDSFEPKPGKIFRSCKNLDLDLTLQICWNICVCHGVQVGHDEVIILSLPCDLSARRTWLFVFHLS